MKLMMDYVVALTHLYGIVHSQKVVDIYQQQNGEQPDNLVIRKIMNEYEEELESRFAYIHDEYFVHEAIMIFDEFDIEMDKKQGKPFYVPPKEELLRYTDPFYIEKNKQYRALLRYMTKHSFAGRRTNAEEICEQTSDLLSAEASIQEIFDDYHHLGVTFDNDTQAQEVIQLVTELSNHTRLWSNNGHTPAEIFELEKKSIGKVSTASQKNSSEKKIGRNDRCPCGSGKKYKKCCMHQI